ncbi:MAG: hypothetical protein QM541_11900 [Flavobacterium sp.]|nr:hypothetical protein [Flavobacterium sp.]
MAEVPSSIDNAERIIRGIYSPMNINIKNNTLKSNFFKLKAGEKGISVIRLDYTTIELSKSHCKTFDNPSKNRVYIGFSLLYANEIRDCKNDAFRAELAHTPKIYSTHTLESHADIEFDFIIEPETPVPPLLNELFERLLVKAKNRVFIDLEPTSSEWKNGDIS